ncbi:hypothetical protein F0562_021050 [Nyssa sinensis]|uniref:TF-B3 domain-containing protein n=1 Tax=Nyssa sinensis TaxID=561372 RepID=A0A5J5BJZ5_9ASTE|nr:hypothetical protein F0562_021050 [Nyssa sinensis]
MDMGPHDEDLHAGDGDGFEEKLALQDPTGFDVVEEEEGMGDGGGGGGSREIWLERQHDQDLLEVNDASMFYTDFLPLPDFPCMSSSSSSSSTRAPAKTIASRSTSSSASASSSAASWAVLKSDAEDYAEKKSHHNQSDRVDTPAAALSSTASMEALPPSDDCIGDVDCMDVMETFGYMDLIEYTNDVNWDPSSIFQSENAQEETQSQQEQSQQQQPQQYQQGNEHYVFQGNNEAVQEERPLDELGIVFFEWLKSNKEYISAEDMRSIKLKRATVECASKRLGSTKEGRKQLLKLILEWVEQYQLQKKRMREAEASQLANYQDHQEHFQNPNPNPNLNCNSIPPDPSTCFPPTPWMPPQIQPPYVGDPASVVAAPPAFPIVAYMGDPYSNGAAVSPFNQTINGHPYSTEYHMLDPAQTWSQAQFALPAQYSFGDNNNLPSAQPHPQALAGYGNQYPYQYYNGNGEKLVRLGSSATKEARKKRMARQRRFFWHHRHQNHHNHQNQQQNQTADQHAGLGSDNCTNTAQANSGNWVYWPSGATPSASTAAVMQPADAPQRNPADRPAMQAAELSAAHFIRQAAEAETHLPELEARDGIPIAMEDIGTSRVWNMRYRFWPNNKSRMYLLENTGDFVRANGLQEGDFIVIYSDVKCGKYLIRGVKVRQPGPKSEGKKSAKSRRNLPATSPAAGNGSSSSHTSQKQ